MKKRFGIVLSSVLVLMSVDPAGAKDRLAIGYTSASGVFAGLWVAQEGRIFEKYDIESRLVLIASGLSDGPSNVGRGSSDREGVQEVLDQIAPRNPKAKTAKPEEFYDDRFAKELDNQGFYKQLEIAINGSLT